MSRTRMNWEDIDGFPVFVYSTFLDHNLFQVKVVIGKKGDFGGNYGPDKKGDLSYTERTCNSTMAVAKKAFENARKHLQSREQTFTMNTAYYAFSWMEKKVPLCEVCGQEMSHDGYAWSCGCMCSNVA